MFWEQMILGWSVYDVILWFIVYSVLGWVVESIYMSYCNRRLTNRGFAKSPMCPIYGVGALLVFFVLEPYSKNPFLLFLLGMTLATLLEWLTAFIMDKCFGEIWWDYKEKPFNYKGILCLESSIAWGFYTLGLFYFLHGLVMNTVDKVPFSMGKRIGMIVLLIYTIDFFYTLYREKKEAISKRIENWKNKFS